MIPNNPKRVLIFSLAYYPHVGGAEVAIKEITDRLPVEEFEFHMLTLRFRNEPKEERVGNVWVHRIGGGLPAVGLTQAGKSYLSKILFIRQAASEARRLHAEKPFDMFWAMMSYMLFPIVLLRRKGISVPYLLTLQEGDPFGHVFNRWFIRPFSGLLRQGFREAGAVQAISTYLARWAKDMGYPGEVAVIPNGVDIAHFSQSFPREKDNIVRLVTTSRLVHKNGIDTVIEALRFLPGNIHFVIYGTGPLESDLRQKVKNLHLESRVHFMGYLAHAEMPRALAACDIFIRPSRSEGMGNSFIEAMAAGLPVIATQEGGIADFLFDAKRNSDKLPTGFAVDTDVPQQIVDTVREILAHPDKTRRVVASAQGLANERYDWNASVARMKVLFAEMS